ncbi:peptide/nickel transport system permease protein [Geomicrobium halophilum]|uniref:Peptide/nickel transport system permease protein n=1 Tax=Geomicrobium halophilum TaxID=549000 RepID=A0A841PLD1_9BACL|nr:ABC transporter permease [Geomicrobium halophilum]MBB6448494.1 peptide/nickel transport system permease protein [Geomicrobium halophilum]
MGSTVNQKPAREEEIGAPESRWKSLFKKLIRNKSSLIGSCILIFFLLVAAFAPFLMTHDPNSTDLLNDFETPSSENWFGTDHNGRDIYSRIVYGTHLTLYVGTVSVAIGAAVGIVLGLFAGYYGRFVDTVIMRVADVLLAFPGILLALAIVSALGASLNNVIIALSIYNIPVFARIVRGSVLEVKSVEYIEAIRALGAKDGKIMFQHILPNVSSPVIVQASLQIATSILSAAGLSFLGVGVQPPTPEWGAMLNSGRSYMWDSPHLTLFPGIALVLVVLGFNLLGDGLRDALDPKSKK